MPQLGTIRRRLGEFSHQHWPQDSRGVHTAARVLPVGRRAAAVAATPAAAAAAAATPAAAVAVVATPATAAAAVAAAIANREREQRLGR